LHPELLKALESRDSKSTLKYYQILQTIQKRAQFRDTLNQVKAGPCLQDWTRFDFENSIRLSMISSSSSLELPSKGSPTSSHTQKKLALDWLESFLLKTCLTHFNKELGWISSTIPQSSKTLGFSYLEYFFSSWTPSLKSRMDLILKIQGPLSFSDVVETYGLVVSFGSQIESLLATLTDSFTSSPESMELGNWGLPLFEEFNSFQKGFAHYERALLLEALSQSLETSRRTSNHIV
jgi:hypothetical protein